MKVVTYRPDNPALTDGEDTTWLRANAAEQFSFSMLPDADLNFTPDHWYVRVRASIGVQLAPCGYTLTFEQGELSFFQMEEGPLTYEGFIEAGTPEHTWLTGVGNSPIRCTGAKVYREIDQPRWLKLHDFYLQAVSPDFASLWNIPPRQETIRVASISPLRISSSIFVP